MAYIVAVKTKKKKLRVLAEAFVVIFFGYCYQRALCGISDNE